MARNLSEKKRSRRRTRRDSLPPSERKELERELLDQEFEEIIGQKDTPGSGRNNFTNER